MKDINRIKLILVEKKKTTKWLEIAHLLEVDITELLVRSDVNRGIIADSCVPYDISDPLK